MSSSGLHADWEKGGVDGLVCRIDEERRIHGGLIAVSFLKRVLTGLMSFFSSDNHQQIVKQLLKVETWGTRLRKVLGEILLDLAENAKDFTPEQTKEADRSLRNIVDEFQNLTAILERRWLIPQRRLTVDQERLWNRVGASIDLTRRDSYSRSLLNAALLLQPVEVVSYLRLAPDTFHMIWIKFVFFAEPQLRDSVAEGVVAYFVSHDSAEFVIEVIVDSYRHALTSVPILSAMLGDRMFSKKFTDALLDHHVGEILKVSASSRLMTTTIQNLTKSLGFARENLERWKEVCQLMLRHFRNLLLGRYETLSSPLALILMFMAHSELRKLVAVDDLIDEIIDSFLVNHAAIPQSAPFEVLSVIVCFHGSDMDHGRCLQRLQMTYASLGVDAIDCLTQLMHSTNTVQTQVELMEKRLETWSQCDWFPFTPILELVNSPYDQVAKLVLKASERNLNCFSTMITSDHGLSLFGELVATRDRVNFVNDKGQTPLHVLLSFPSQKKKWRAVVCSLLESPEIDKTTFAAENSLIDFVLVRTREAPTDDLMIFHDVLTIMFKNKFPSNDGLAQQLLESRVKEPDLSFWDLKLVELILGYTKVQVTKVLVEMVSPDPDRIWSGVMYSYLTDGRYWTTIMSVKGRVGRNSALKILPSDILRRVKFFLNP